jgi:hypothetical protein
VVVILLEPECKQTRHCVSEMRTNEREEVEPERRLEVDWLTGIIVEARRSLRCCEQPGGDSDQLTRGKCGGGGALLIAHGSEQETATHQWN